MMLQSYKTNIIRQKKCTKSVADVCYLVHPRLFSCNFVSIASTSWLNQQKVYYHKSKTKNHYFQQVNGC